MCSGLLSALGQVPYLESYDSWYFQEQNRVSFARNSSKINIRPVTLNYGILWLEDFSIAFLIPVSSTKRKKAMCTEDNTKIYIYFLKLCGTGYNRTTKTVK